MPKVSVVIPCYNAEKFAETCLETLLAQTLQDLEFIFVDDGSTDATAGILDSFKERDARVRVIHQENKCLGGARNTGIEAAQGEYIGFLDADDKLSENYFEALYTAAKRHDADIAWGNLKRYRKNKPPTYYYPPFTEERVIDDLQIMVNQRSNHVVTKIYRRTLFADKTLLFREGCFYEDIYFTLPIVFAANKIVTVPGADYHYIFVESSIAHRKRTPALRKSEFDGYVFRRDFIQKKGYSVPRHLQKIRKSQCMLGPICLFKIRDCGDYDEALLFDFIPLARIPHKK